ncbi:MAG: hypothetical protein EBT13_05040 [Rhodobacteraceae bacterium]|nr:hypothetical protein [Paracoccaceae bacterium]
MATLAEFRQQYPQYDDMSDAEVAARLYVSNYSDMSVGDFAKRLELPEEQAVPFMQEVHKRNPEYRFAFEQPKVGVGEDVFRGLVSGAQRGFTGMADLAKAGLAPDGYTAAAEITSPDSIGIQRREGGGFGEVTRAAERIIPRYEPQTTAGEYASTVGEFLPGAVLSGGGLGGLLKYGVVPAIASEAAGQATEGTRYEPYARIGAAVAAPIAVQGGINLARRALSPAGGADPERLAAAARLRAEGVTPTAGQETGSRAIRAMEGVAKATDEQLDDFTAAAMRTTGSESRRATQEAIVAADRRIGAEYDRILSNVSVVPDTSVAQRAMSAVDDYLQNAPAAEVTPRIRNVAMEIIDAATSKTPRPIPLETLRRWRTELGKLVSSNSEATTDAARALRSAIDEATDSALIAAGRADDLAALRTAREQWWNLLGIKDAASRAGEGARVGVITPESLRGAVRRTQGADAISMGRGTPLAALATSGEAVLATAPTVMPQGVRAVQGLPYMLGAGLGGAVGSTAGPIGTAVGMAAGAAAPEVGRLAVNHPLVQMYLRNQAVGAPTERLLSPRILPALSGLLAQ